MTNANNQLLANPACGVVDVVELEDFLNRVRNIVHDLEEVEIFRTNETELEKVIGQEFQPCFPIHAIGPVEQHHRNDARFARLHESEHFEGLVHRPKAARKKRESVGFFYEIQFTGEEVIEIDELRIAVDCLVGALFEGKPNIKTEAVLAPRATL